MSNKLNTLLTGAIISGLLAVNTAKAEGTSTPKSNDQMSAEKNGCQNKTAPEKNGCKQEDAKKKKKDKNSCKNGCGEAKDAPAKTEKTK